MTGWTSAQEHDQACELLFEMSERWAERYRPKEPIDLQGVRLPPPSYRGNNPYNGFTAEERIFTDRVIILLRRQGLLPKPTQCEICGASERIGYHGENYYDPYALIQICFPCHMAVHRRFKSLDSFRRRFARYGLAHLLSLPVVEPDFAGWLREFHPNQRGLSALRQGR